MIPPGQTVRSRSWRLYEVTVRLWGQAHARPVSARSPAAARYRAYLDADLDMPFRDYQRHASVRLYPGDLADDGYGYVRRAYGVDPRIGQRVTLTGEGSAWNRREGEVVYPGASRQYVHVVFDGYRQPVVCHPQSIVFLLPAKTTPSASDLRPRLPAGPSRASLADPEQRARQSGGADPLPPSTGAHHA